jgi:hypothetical protein
MEGIKDLIKESNELLDNLYSQSNESSKRISSQEELREEVATFVVSQMNRIQKQDILRGLIEAELANKVLLHELSTDELQSLYVAISKEKSSNTMSLLDMFKPTNASPNSLMTPPTKEEENNSLDYSPEQRQALEKLTKIIEMVEKRQSNEE